MSAGVRVRVALPRKAEDRKAAHDGPVPVPRVAQLLALAHQIDGMIRRGEIRNMAEAARVCGVTRARMSQVMNLTLLAPDLQEAILIDETGFARERQLRPLALEPLWPRQLRQEPAARLAAAG